MDCPIRSACLGKSAQEKKFTVTYYRAEYERNIARVNSKKGSYMKGKRQSTVEPVFGTLTQFLGMGKKISSCVADKYRPLIKHLLRLLFMYGVVLSGAPIYKSEY
jgi:hypothetical protein